MRINKSIVLALLLISLLTITAVSQISPTTDIVSKTYQITPNINLEEKETCTTIFYDEVQELYGNCLYYLNYTSCLNTSGPNTDCSLQQNTKTFTCKTGESVIKKNRTECKPNNEFIISIDNGVAIAKKQIDFSDWGACIHEVKNNCLIVTCQSIYDGANDGRFHGCSSGTSCQKFQVCDNSIKTFYKNSREDFVEEDPTFHLSKLAYKEVGE